MWEEAPCGAQAEPWGLQQACICRDQRFCLWGHQALAWGWTIGEALALWPCWDAAVPSLLSVEGSRCNGCQPMALCRVSVCLSRW